MKAPKHREYVHHVRTERGVSTYQIRRGAGDAAEVVAAVVVIGGSEGSLADAPLQAHCTTCNRSDCAHARRVLERANGGK